MKGFGSCSVASDAQVGCGSDARIYVSAVAADGSWQCADTPVPLAGVGSPRTVLTGNHLLIVDQVPTAGDVATVLRWFEVDASGCGSGWSR